MIPDNSSAPISAELYLVGEISATEGYTLVGQKKNRYRIHNASYRGVFCPSDVQYNWSAPSRDRDNCIFLGTPMSLRA